MIDPITITNVGMATCQGSYLVEDHEEEGLLAIKFYSVVSHDRGRAGFGQYRVTRPESASGKGSRPCVRHAARRDPL